MNTRMRKLFSLGDMKYGWLLAVSMAICAVTFYMDRRSDQDDQFLLAASYGVSFAVAVLWGALNYIGHIRLNAMYRQHRDIHVYVEQLAMSRDDKQELMNYLEDYAGDLISQGMTEADANAAAIAEFRVKELLRLSKNTSLFQLHAHYYLLGWTIAAVILFIPFELVRQSLSPDSFWLILIESLLAAYGAGLFGLFFAYKLLDILIHRKLREQLF